MHVQEVAQEVAALQELTRKPPQEAKVLYFCGFNPQEHWNARSKKCSLQDAEKLLQASRRRKTFFLVFTCKKFVDILHLFITTSFVPLNLSSWSDSAAAKDNHARTHVKR